MQKIKRKDIFMKLDLIKRLPLSIAVKIIAVIGVIFAVLSIIYR